jgi:predicted transposase/invertase (TIGR01784 family)
VRWHEGCFAAGVTTDTKSPPHRTPHDTLFHHVFSQPEHAAPHLRSLLPPELVARIDWSTLTPAPERQVEVPELRNLFVDVLFSVQIDGREGYLYLLLEHQSSPDALMPFRVLRYIVSIWTKYLLDNPEAQRLPAIIPIVVHHGEGRWRKPVRFAELVDLDSEALAVVDRYLPGFELLLDDLAVLSPEQLRARKLSAMGTLTLFALQRARESSDILSELRSWLAAMRQVLAAPNGIATLAPLIHYLTEVTETKPAEMARFFRAQLGPKGQRTMATTADQLRAEERANILLDQLRERFPPLSPEVTERVRSASADDLARWLRRVVKAERIEDVLA